MPKRIRINKDYSRDCKHWYLAGWLNIADDRCLRDGNVTEARMETLVTTKVYKRNALLDELPVWWRRMLTCLEVQTP